MQYKWNKIELLSAVTSIFEQSEAIVLDFQDDSIFFLSMLCDGAMGVYACVKSPNITRNQVKNFKSEQKVFFTKELRQGIKICRNASKGVSEFLIKVVGDGLILCSKQNKLTVNKIKIRCIDEQIPDYNPLKNDFNRLQDFLCLTMAAKHLNEGLSGIDSKIDDVVVAIAPCKKKMTRGNLSLEYHQDFMKFEHLVQLPTNTACSLATVKFEGTWAGSCLCILKKIMDKFPAIYAKSIGEDEPAEVVLIEETKTNKRKRNKNEEQENNDEDEATYNDDKINIVLRVLNNEDTSLGIFYSLNEVVVKVYIAPRQNNETTE